MVNKDALSQARTIVRYGPAPQRRGPERVHHLSDNIVRRRLTKGQSAMAMAYPEPKRGVHPELKKFNWGFGLRRRTCRPTPRRRQPKLRRWRTRVEFVDDMAAER